MSSPTSIRNNRELDTLHSDQSAKPKPSVPETKPAYPSYNPNDSELKEYWEEKRSKINGYHYLDLVREQKSEFENILKKTANSYFGEKELTDEIKNLIYLSVTIRRILSHEAVYPNADTNEKVAYLSHLIVSIGLCIQGDMQDSKWISHALRDLSEKQIERAQTNLSDKEMLYARIPWRKLEGIARFINSLYKEEKYYTDNDKELFKEAIPELISNFKVIDDYITNILNFYQSDKKAIAEQKPVIAIHALGSFVRDKDSFYKIQTLIYPIIRRYEKNPKVLLKKNYRWAVLGSLNILGEVSIILSQQMKAKCLAESSWNAVRGIRNSFHNTEKQMELHEKLVYQDNTIPLREILKDLEALHEPIPLMAKN